MAFVSETAYSDLNHRLGNYGQPPILRGEKAVRTAIVNLFSSYVGSRSRTFNQTWGSDLLTLLHEPITPVTASAIKASVLASMKLHEPRATPIESLTQVEPDLSIPGYKVLLVYKITAFESFVRQQLTLEV